MQRAGSAQGGGRRWRPPATPLLWLATGMLAGQLAAPTLPGAAFPFALAASATFCLSTAGGRRTLWALGLCAAAAGHLMLDARLRPRLASADVVRWAGEALPLRGTIAARPQRRASGLRFVLAVDAVRRRGAWEPACGRVQVTVRAATRLWQDGDRLVAALRLREPRNFGNPGELDYEGFLARRAIYVTAYVADDADWLRLPRLRPPSLLQEWRRQAMAILTEVVPAELQSLAVALLFGDGGAIPAAVRSRYARAGVSHVLAVSGLHVGLVASAAYAGLRWLLSRSETLLLCGNVPKLAALASAPPLVVYALLARGGVATTRAALMGTLVIAALALDRPRDWSAGLAAAALLVSVVEPGAVFDASFQLSFAAVIAIVAGGGRVNAWLIASAEERLLRLHSPRRLRLERWLVLGQGVSLCALAGTAPLTLYHFHQLSLVGAIANTVVVPLLGVGTVGLGLVATLLAPLAPGLSACFFAAASVPLAAGDRLVALFAAWRFAALHPFSPSTFELLLLYAILALPFAAPSWRGRAALLCAVLAIADLAHCWTRRFADGSLRVTFFSVGQGDSALLRFPGGVTMLVDGGGLSSTFDVGERVLAPQLWREKIHHLDFVVLSHADFDHYGGLPALLDAFRPGEFWHGGGSAPGKRFAAVRAAMRRAEATEVLAVRGHRLEVGGVVVESLHPATVARDRANDRSLTMQVRYGNVAMLFAGDLEGPGESALLGARRDLRSTILKVPHHGSRTSSTAAFLAAVRPQLAVVSCGFRNRFGMPHAEVVEAYRRRGALFLRTDRDGAVTLRVERDGRLTVRSGRRVWRLRVDARGEITGPPCPAFAPCAAPRA